MAELTAPEPSPACCTPVEQAACCEPDAKDACCGAAAGGGSCGCAAGQTTEPVADIRETVREKYAAAARHAAERPTASCGCGPASDAVFGSALYAECWCCDAEFDPAEVGEQTFGAVLYGEEAGDTPAAAVNASLGCGVPTAVADLHEGETVLDLGSGAGADVLISAKRVGATGRAIGLDMTDEMLDLARANASEAGVANVEFVKGYIEDIPLADNSVDVVISNCVINLAGDKRKVLAEAARVLRPGGRFAVSDVIADPDMDDATRADMAAYTGCIAGALTEDEFRAALDAAGLTDVEIRETHRVHASATSAIVRARKAVDGLA
jgi:arsenite methyltransferase